jgi:hypothetical protein
MSDPVYNHYIAKMRALISGYGAENAINALVLAFDAESEDDTNTDRTKNYCGKVSYELSKVFEELKKL